MWRHRGAGGTAVAGVYNFAKSVDGQLASPYVDQCPDNRTNHIPEETVGSNDKCMS